MTTEKLQEDVRFDPELLLHLGSPAIIVTTRHTDEDIPIMFSDSCHKCGSRKRRCLTPSFIPTKKTILIDPTSMKGSDLSNVDDGLEKRRCLNSYSKPISIKETGLSTDTNDGSHQKSPPVRSTSIEDRFPHNPPQISPSFGNSIRTPLPRPRISPLRRSVSELMTRSTSSAPGSSKSPKSPPETSAAVTGRRANLSKSRSFSGSFDIPKVKTPSEATPAKPTFQIIKAPSTAVPTDSSGLMMKTDEKAILKDGKDPSPLLISHGTCKLVRSNQELLEEGVKKVQFTCTCGKYYEVSFSSDKKKKKMMKNSNVGNFLVNLLH